MSPEECITALDRALETAGEDMVLQRLYGETPNTQPVKVTVRARPFGGKLILSPTQIAVAQWPGGEVPSEQFPVPSLPRYQDEIISANSKWTVQHCEPFRMDNVLVRLELTLVGYSPASPVNR